MGEGEMLNMNSLPGVGILISGRGSNMEAILKAEREGNLAGRVNLVISNTPDAKGLKTAKAYGKRAVYISSKNMKEFEKRAREELDEAGCEYVVLAGFMRILSSDFTRIFHGRCINIHPALLPSFPGLHAQKQAVEAGVRISGCTVHFVTDEVDGGPIILQRAVPVYSHDTEESLSRRILRFEHMLLPYVLNLLLQGKIRLDGRKVAIEMEENVHREVWSWD